MNMNQQIEKAAELIKNSKHTTVFTGAGISVESGISPFRGEGGVWNKYNEKVLDIEYFKNHPTESWQVIRELFYTSILKAAPNEAHKALAELEKNGIVKAVITQNIDNLHQLAGSLNVYEFHGTLMNLLCLKTGKKYFASEDYLAHLPPFSPDGGLLKPDCVFFGEGIPEEAYQASVNEAYVADVFLIIGTTGEVFPAAQIPVIAKKNGAKVVEINPKPSNYTHQITDIFIQDKAANALLLLKNLILK